jgi:hypothetical protein
MTQALFSFKNDADSVSIELIENHDTARYEVRFMQTNDAGKETDSVPYIFENIKDAMNKYLELIQGEFTALFDIE